MLLLYILFLIAIDIISFLTLSRERIIKGKTAIRFLKVIHILLSLCSWIIFIMISLRKGEFADNRNISLMLLMGLIGAMVWIPRLIIILFSNIAHIIRKRYSLLAGAINSGGIALSMVIITTVCCGAFVGRFNFKFENVEIKYNKLPPGLHGFKIVQLSDMHLSSFHNKEDRLEKLISDINLINPDIIVNTGDYVTIAWNELAPFTGILNKSESRYGNFAIPGNHDAGTYHPRYSEKDKAMNVNIIDSLLLLSGYTQLKDSSIILNIKNSRLKIAGVITLGTIPDIIFGDLDKALGNEYADFTLLLSHDPNHWYYELKDRDIANLTLSGHTHGGQFGIRIGKFRWSPASMLYPAWNGLYGGNNNYLYVNRGLGTISLPARIGMPPEVTIITLLSEN